MEFIAPARVVPLRRSPAAPLRRLDGARPLGARAHPSTWSRPRACALCSGTASSRSPLSLPRAPVGTIVFKNRRALLSWLWDPDLNFGETYMFGAVDVRGDLVAGARRNLPRAGPRDAAVLVAVAAIERRARRQGERPSPLRSRERVLRSAGSIARWPTRAPTSRRRRRRSKRRRWRRWIASAGSSRCGRASAWSKRAAAGAGLALYMARHYGVTVRALNISSEQIAYARERARAERLDDRVEFVEDDYRNVRGQYDAFVSIGMLEHVGAADYPTLGAVIDRSLTDHGRGLLHFIGRNRPSPLNPWIRKRIFPGAYPPAPVRGLRPRARAMGPVRDRRRKPPAPLCRDAGALARAVRVGGRRRRRRCSTTPSCGPGGCISRDRRRRSPPDRCSCSRWCSRARGSNAIPWTRCG